MRQISTVDHGNRERAAGPAQDTMILGNRCCDFAVMAQDHGDRALCSTGRWFSPGDRSRRSPLAFLRAAVPGARVLVGGLGVVEEGGLGVSPWWRAASASRIASSASVSTCPSRLMWDTGTRRARRTRPMSRWRWHRAGSSSLQSKAMRDDLCFGQYLVEAAAERRGLGELAVEHVALLVVELPALRPAAELVAHRDVGDPAPGQGFTERSRAEVRHVAGAGHGTHVGACARPPAE